MSYKIMYYDDYETEDGAKVTNTVEFDGVLYESRIAAWRAYWEKKRCNEYPVTVGYHVYVEEV